MQIIATCGI